MAPKPPYICPRCGYETRQKGHIRMHFFDVKKKCPSLVNDVELTEDIKKHILENRIYRIPQPSSAPPPPTQIINQTINMNNYINNYVGSMDVMNKLGKYVEYKRLPLLGYEDTIRNRYEDDANCLIQCKTLDVEVAALRRDDILAIVDCVTKVSEAGSTDDSIELNVLYDNKAKKLRLYQDGVWDDDMVLIGVKKLIISIQQIYLDMYECYLIQKLKDPDTHFSKRYMGRTLLEEYYKFIGCFSVFPYIKGKTNQLIVNGYNDDNKYSLEEEYMALYTTVTGRLTKQEMKQTCKDVVDIIKGNTKRNIDDLNRKVINLIHMDESFKEELFNMKPSAINL